MGVDINVAKDAASGHWARIANGVIGISDDFLATAHGPCPKCGGTDRWRVFDDFEETGGALCNQCGKFGDGFALAQHFLGVPFFETVDLVCRFLGVEDKKSKRSKSKSINPAPKPTAEPKTETHRDFSELEFVDWRPRLFDTWAATKQPITEEAVKLAGGRFARYRGMTVLAIPITGRDGAPSGYAVYNATGNPIPYKPKGSEEIQQLKVKIVGANNESGWIGRFLPGKVTIKAEGVSDTLALLSANPNASVICNPFGSLENPLGKHNQWMLQQLRGETVWTVHDRDEPGLAGATWVDQSSGKKRPGWAVAIAIVAKESRNLELPFELSETHGKDSRDFLLEHSFADLVELAKNCPTVPKPEGYEVGQPDKPTKVIESEKDPHRLAKLNLENYGSRYGGRLVYWRDEWWKWKRDRYKKLDAKELRAKLTECIKEEFDRIWHEEYEAYEEKRKSPGYDPEQDKGPPSVREIHPGLIKAVMLVMESICNIPWTIDLQTWLDGREKKQYLAAENGIIDIEAYIKDENEILLEHSSNWFSASCLRYPFDPNANCDTWLKFIDFAMGEDQKKIDVIQEFLGYLLLPSTKFQKFLAVEGTGGNGKSVFFATLEAMLGIENISNVRLEKFKGQFDLGATIGKMANMCGEVSDIDPTGESILKQFTGGEYMSFDRKNRDQVKAKPTAKIVLSWNEKPEFRDSSDGLWRRMILVQFNREVPESMRVYGMDEVDWWIKSGEVPGILNWALAGLDRLIRQNGFTMSQSIADAIDEYKNESINSRRFLKENYRKEERKTSMAEDIYEHYRDWCYSEGEKKVVTKSELGKQIKKYFPDAARRRSTDEGRKWYYQGIERIYEAELELDAYGEKLKDRTLF